MFCSIDYSARARWERLWHRRFFVIGVGGTDKVCWPHFDFAGRIGVTLERAGTAQNIATFLKSSWQ